MLRHLYVALSISALVLGAWMVCGTGLTPSAPGRVLSRDQASRVFGGQSGGCNRLVLGSVKYCNGTDDKYDPKNPCGLTNCEALMNLPDSSIPNGNNSLDETICSEKVCKKDLKKYSCGTAYVEGCSK